MNFGITHTVANIPKTPFRDNPHYCGRSKMHLFGKSHTVANILSAFRRVEPIEYRRSPYLPRSVIRYITHLAHMPMPSWARALPTCPCPAGHGPCPDAPAQAAGRGPCPYAHAQLGTGLVQMPLPSWARALSICPCPAGHGPCPAEQSWRKSILTP